MRGKAEEAKRKIARAAAKMLRVRKEKEDSEGASPVVDLPAVESQ